MVKWVAFIFRSLDLFVKNFACNNKILHTCMDHVCGVFPPPIKRTTLYFVRRFLNTIMFHRLRLRSLLALFDFPL